MLSRLALITVLAAAALVAGPASAAEAPQPSDEVDAPLSLRGTRGAPHPDCANAVPLWEHVVEPGEHLGLIAGRYGVRRSDLVRQNADLRDPNHIVPGQKIRVCPEIAPRQRKEVEHVVAKGETLSHIAARYDLSVPELLEVLEGRVANPNLVVVGKTLRFSVDDGVVEAFLPPLPKKRGGASASATPRHRVNVQLQAAPGVTIKRPYLAYGTQKTIRLLHGVVSSYRGRHDQAPPVLIGDISKRGGGQIQPHLSHRSGRDIDMGYVLKGEDGLRTRFSGVNRDTLDVARTWALVKAFLDTDEVVYIFMDYGMQKTLYEHAKARGVSKDELDELFQYPRGRGRNYGIIRHWRSHKNHFHVRFKH